MKKFSAFSVMLVVLLALGLAVETNWGQLSQGSLMTFNAYTTLALTKQ